MNKKGKTLFVKILLGIPLLLALLAGVNNVFMGLTREDLIGKMAFSLPMTFVMYVIVGLATLITAISLFVKMYVKKSNSLS